jgi:hypothetical protein
LTEKRYIPEHGSGGMTGIIKEEQRIWEKRKLRENARKSSG